MANNDSGIDDFDPLAWVLAAKAKADAALTLTADGEVKVKKEKKATDDGVHPLDRFVKKDYTGAENVPGFPVQGSLDYSGFLAAIKSAGKMSEAEAKAKGVVRDNTTDPKRERLDQIRAVQAYVGYSFGEPHGVQLDNAKRLALTQRDIKNGSLVITTSDYRKGSASAKAFVAGMPDLVKTKILDLFGRMKYVRDLRDAKNAAAMDEEDNLLVQMQLVAEAEFENERLIQIVKDLDLYLATYPDARELLESNEAGTDNNNNG